MSGGARAARDVRSLVPALALWAASTALGCGASRQHGDAPMTITVTSAAFGPGASIPAEHTCDGADGSPALTWSGVPSEARSLALVMDDPDAPRGTWVHWVLYGLPPSTRTLAAALPKTPRVSGGARQGKNDFERDGYGGPCPPPGPAHRYFFELYALDGALELAPGATKAQLEQAMDGHVIARGELMGRYQRRQ